MEHFTKTVYLNYLIWYNLILSPVGTPQTIGTHSVEDDDINPPNKAARTQRSALILD